jgi:hypothetical protein
MMARSAVKGFLTIVPTAGACEDLPTLDAGECQTQHEMSRHPENLPESLGGCQRRGRADLPCGADRLAAAGSRDRAAPGASARSSCSPGRPSCRARARRKGPAGRRCTPARPSAGPGGSGQCWTMATAFIAAPWAPAIVGADRYQPLKAQEVEEDRPRGTAAVADSPGHPEGAGQAAG